MHPPRIAPSLLSSDFGRLAEEIRAVEAAGAELHHVDVMDGRFVPNMTLGPPIVAAMKEAAKVPLDVHLMIVEPERWTEAFVEAGAAWLSFHIEATPHAHRLLQAIRKAGAEPGVVLTPQTPVVAVEELLEEAHHVLVMSVNPGFGGQSFIPRALHKVAELARMRRERGLSFAIEVDGGIKASNAAALTEAGADVLVAGSAVFDAPDYRVALDALNAEARAGAARRRP